MSYAALKSLHVTCVVISISLFLLRGGLQLAGNEWRRHLWLRILPHVNDTALLIAALWMVWQLPETAPYQWIYAKIAALLGYIFLGKKALSASTAATQRLPFFLGSLTCISYIVGVALTRSPTLGLMG